jgi:histidinol-phosphate aminotransferase
MVQPHFAFAAWAIAAKAAGATVISAPERNYTVDVDALLAAVDRRTRVVFIANPANPTGTSVPFRDIERFHRALPENVVLVLDAAYAEFAEDRVDYDDGLRLALTAPNVVLTRTFSKLHGLAALRVGWGYASAPVIDVLNRIRLPFNVSSAAQAAAIAALSDASFISQSLAFAREGRVRLTRTLAAAGLSPLPSAANFVTAISADGAAAAQTIERRLAERGILVRGLANYDMPEALRITVGTESETRLIERALSEILPIARCE